MRLPADQAVAGGCQQLRGEDTGAWTWGLLLKSLTVHMPKNNAQSNSLNTEDFISINLFSNSGKPQPLKSTSSSSGERSDLHPVTSPLSQFQLVVWDKTARYGKWVMQQTSGFIGNFLACHILCYHLTSGSVYSQPGDGDGTEITVLIFYVILGRLHTEANDLCWSV